MDKPDWDGIALAFDTTSIIIRNIHKKMMEEIIYGTTVKLLTPSTHRIITTEMEEAVAYLVGSVLVIYQDEIAQFLYDTYTVRVHQTQVSRLLKRLDITHKRLSVQPKQRNQEL